MLPHLFKRWCRNSEGVVAVEMGLLALPFFVLLMGTIEISLAFASGVILEGASASAARLIRTGQVQMAAAPEQLFKERLCEQTSSMMDCDDIQYEVIRVAANTFAGAAILQPQFDANGRLIPSGFSTGNSNDVVLIRAVYRYEFLTPFIGNMMTGTRADNSITHVTTVVVRAEPYIFGEE